MKKNYSRLIFSFILIVALFFPFNSYAQNNENFSNIEKQLGVSTGGKYSNIDTSTISIGIIIKATIIDPTKLGGCEAGDKVVFTKLEDKRWSLKHVGTGNLLIFNVKKEGGIVKVSKSGSYADKKPQSNYKYSFAIKGGIYEPTDDLEDFDTGFSGEVSITQYFSPNFAVESAIGYFQTDYNEIGNILSFPYSGTIDISAIPITVNLKGIIPFQLGEIYVGAGVGAYFVHGDLDVSVAGVGSYSADDNDVIIGAQLLAGLNFNVTDTTFFGIEGKYIFTDEASMGQAQIGTVDFDINGYTIMGVLGFRF
ncbi:hypothetical protein [Desulfobacula sp.]|uniref:hypothetical protein n=1 Tax=Desulfobacula sp. TaxID=2593537 RepID=UPI00261E5205|nr:hypothetical protein [Desulfobacula sp.]